MYSLEQIFPTLALKDYRRTRNPLTADFFIVPHDATCLSHQLLGTLTGSVFDAAKIVGDKYLTPLLHYMIQHHPYYNASSGSNHVYVFPHDVGVCLFSKNIQEIVQKGIVLSNLGLSPSSNVSWHMSNEGCYQCLRDVVVPPPIFIEGPNTYKSPDSLIYLASFRGTVWENPQYSLGARQKVQHLHLKYGQVFNFHNSSTDSHSYYQELISSKFYLCMGGWQPWSPRLFEAIELGAIPVIISDGIELPFEREVEWRKFSVKVRHKNLDNLAAKLKTITAESIREKQNYMRTVRDIFSWKRGGAFEKTLKEIDNRFFCARKNCAIPNFIGLEEY
jgi:hypothetical protein